MGCGLARELTGWRLIRYANSRACDRARLAAARAAQIIIIALKYINIPSCPAANYLFPSLARPQILEGNWQRRPCCVPALAPLGRVLVVFSRKNNVNQRIQSDGNRRLDGRTDEH